MNQLSQFLKTQEKPDFPFVPSLNLYFKTGIGRKRFHQILRNEASPTLAEIEAIAKYFNVAESELLKLKSA